MASDAKVALDAQMTEDELLTAIVRAAHLHGWLVYHIRNSKAGVVQGDPGFPDLVLARNGPGAVPRTQEPEGPHQPGAGPLVAAPARPPRRATE